jgi:hypothetical protein
LRATTSSVTTSSLKASPAALFVVPQPVRVVSKIVSDQFPGPVQSAASSKPSSFSP